MSKRHNEIAKWIIHKQGCLADLDSRVFGASAVATAATIDIFIFY